MIQDGQVRKLWRLLSRSDSLAPAATVRGGVPKDEPYFTDVLTDRAVEFIERHANRPFFLYFSHFAVHVPVLARADKIAEYQERLATDPPGPHELGNAHYAAMVESVDDSVGRVLQTLRRLNLEQKTLVVFFSGDRRLKRTGGGGKSALNLDPP